MDVIIIVVHRGICIGEAMITGIISTGLILEECTTTNMNTTTGKDIIMDTRDITIN